MRALADAQDSRETDHDRRQDEERQPPRRGPHRKRERHGAGQDCETRAETPGEPVGAPGRAARHESHRGAEPDRPDREQDRRERGERQDESAHGRAYSAPPGIAAISRQPTGCRAP